MALSLKEYKQNFTPKPVAPTGKILLKKKQGLQLNRTGAIMTLSVSARVGSGDAL